jgi:hypothetical protein
VACEKFFPVNRLTAIDSLQVLAKCRHNLRIIRFGRL